MSESRADSGAARAASAAPGGRPTVRLPAWWAALVGAVGALALGCREAGTGAGESHRPAECAAVGQRCEVSPGKLGTCVAIDGCRGVRCFVCQSQH